MVDELVIEGGVNGFPDGEVVVGFKNLLDSVRQGSVSGEDTGATGGKEAAVNM